jgi:hypothetical protein
VLLRVALRAHCVLKRMTAVDVLLVVAAVVSVVSIVGSGSVVAGKDCHVEERYLFYEERNKCDKKKERNKCD